MAKRSWVVIPVGIITKNRAVYLNETLRSIGRVPVTVYDDCSDDRAARDMLYSDREFSVEHSWPSCLEHCALEDDPTIRGIDGLIPVVRFEEPHGVVNGSCRAITDMFEDNPEADAVILLQDDVVMLSTDWYRRMTSVTRDGLGILAGMTLFKRRGFYSAQCYLITREFFEKTGFFLEFHGMLNFDLLICRDAKEHRMRVDLITPNICEHIGVKSQVRPDRGFQNRNGARVAK